MPNAKQLPCCARRQAKLTMDQANLARLARRAARAAQRGETEQLARWQAKIAENQNTIAADKQAIVEHDADHAGGGL